MKWGVLARLWAICGPWTVEGCRIFLGNIKIVLLYYSIHMWFRVVFVKKFRENKVILILNAIEFKTKTTFIYKNSIISENTSILN